MNKNIATVTASIFVGNMTPAQRTAIEHMPRGDVEELTGFRLVDAASCYRAWDGDLVNFHLHIDRSDPSYSSDAFVREDFIGALLDVIGAHP
jgi:hypothetical protein